MNFYELESLPSTPPSLASSRRDTGMKRSIGNAVYYVSSGEMAEDRKRCKYKTWKRRQRKLDAALKDGSIDHDTYVRAQIWLEKIRDW